MTELLAVVQVQRYGAVVGLSLVLLRADSVIVSSCRIGGPRWPASFIVEQLADFG